MKWLSLLALLLIVLASPADEPCKSGLQPKQRPGPYAALVSVGPQRGQHHCYICEAGDRPTVIIFARTLSTPLGKLVRRLDQLLVDHKAAELRGWVTLLHEDATAFDPEVVQWSKQHRTGSVPIAIFEDKVGPPTYLLHQEADVTVLISAKQKVVANFAFRKNELNDQDVAEIAQAVQRLRGIEK